MEEFENVEYLNTLYDLYKELLTAKQQECFELYFFEDYKQHYSGQFPFGLPGLACAISEKD